MSNVKVIAVIGAGPVGALQALFLARNGHKVLVFEKRKDSRKSGLSECARRSINLTLSRRGIRVLEKVGCKEMVMSHALPVKGRMIHSINGEISKQHYSRDEENVIYSINRKLLNDLLLSAAEKECNITIYFGYELCSCNERDALLIFKTSTGETTVKVDFVFGCDGAHSSVRNMMMRWGRLDYSQEYIDHGYKELKMPSTAEGGHALLPEYLHIWPRNDFVLLALPNKGDGTFTISLFMPLKKFEGIQTDKAIYSFFVENFPDFIGLVGANQLLTDYKGTQASSLVTIKCSRYYLGKEFSNDTKNRLSPRTVLLGDAAHACVPFYGQGVNAGMEDCLVFNECYVKEGGDLERTSKLFSDIRCQDGHAIADLSIGNYTVLQRPKTFLYEKEKQVVEYLHSCRFFKSHIIPQYTMVAFSEIPYQEIKKRERAQRLRIICILFVLCLVFVVLVLVMAGLLYFTL